MNNLAATSNSLRATPSIGIITTSWNGLPRIGEPAESVRCQSYRNLEWSVSDKNSSDGTRNILGDLRGRRDDRIRMVFKDSNPGAIGNPSFLCEQGTSMLTSILRQDEYLASTESIAIILHQSRRLDPPAGAAVRWNAEEINDAGPKEVLAHELSQLAFCMHGYIPGNVPDATFRKSTWQSMGTFNQNYYHAQDFYCLALSVQSFSLRSFANKSCVRWKASCGQASKHLNKMEDLYQKLAEVTSQVYSRIPRRGGLAERSLMVAGSLVYGTNYRRGLRLQSLKGSPVQLHALTKSCPHNNHLLSQFLSCMLFFAGHGGSLGKKIFVARAWHLNHSDKRLICDYQDTLR